MLLRYLTELKKSLSEEDFKNFIKDVERDIKINRIAFSKRTSQRDFIGICESYKIVLGRC